MWSRRKGNKMEYAGYFVKAGVVRKVAGRAASFLSQKISADVRVHYSLTTTF